MAIINHTFFKHHAFAFPNEYSSLADSQLFPFNNSFLFNDMDVSDADWMKDRAYYRATGSTKMNPCPLMMKPISRIINAGRFSALKGYGGWGRKGNDIYVDYYDSPAGKFNAEVDSYASDSDVSRSARILIKVDENGRMSAVCLDEFGGEKPYIVRTKSSQSDVHSGSAALMGLLAWLAYGPDNCAKEEITLLLEQIGQGITDDILLWYRSERALENLIWGLMCKTSDFESIGWNIHAERWNDPQIPFMPRTDFENAELDEFHGDSPVIGKQSGIVPVRPKKARTVGELAASGEYTLNDKRVLSPEEEALVPRLDGMIPGEEILNKVKLIRESTMSPRPFRNILWTGETGTGKSTAAMIAAQLMHLPYRFMTFNPDTLVSDLYVNILPNTKKTLSFSSEELADILEDALIDPDGAYERLTGRRKENCRLSEVIDTACGLAQGSDFISVRSPLVETFEHGGVCELQEVNLASKPGVLAGINAALDDLATIQLPDGEVVRRHPDAIIICSANCDYEGTRRLNKAVKSRMTLKGVFHLPDDAVLIDRIVQNSGFRDRQTIRKMVKVMHSIRKELEENGETNGVCSVREVQSWAQACGILSDPYEAAMATIIPSASDDPEVVEACISALNSQFTPKQTMRKG